MSETVEQFWERFLRKFVALPRDTIYQSWYFGDSPEMARELADLVIAGRKTATASLKAYNDIHWQTCPVEGVMSVVTDFDGVPLCVIKTVEIRDVPFRDVDAVFAADEGEGDLSLEYWRRVHFDYFTREAAEHNLEFNEDSIICCERFKLIFAE